MSNELTKEAIFEQLKKKLGPHGAYFSYLAPQVVPKLLSGFKSAVSKEPWVGLDHLYGRAIGWLEELKDADLAFAFIAFNTELIFTFNTNVQVSGFLRFVKKAWLMEELKDDQLVEEFYGFFRSGDRFYLKAARMTKGSRIEEATIELTDKDWELAVSMCNEENPNRPISLEYSAAVLKERKKKENALTGNPIEKFCQDNFDLKALDKSAKKADCDDSLFANVLYKDKNTVAPVFVVKCAVLSYMGLAEATPKEIGKYNKAFITVEILEKADKVMAELDRDSFISALEKISDLGLAPAYPQILLPLCRYGDGTHIKKVISCMGDWDDWDSYSALGRSAIIIARGAIFLNESAEAKSYVEKIKELKRYNDMRKAY